MKGGRVPFFRQDAGAFGRFFCAFVGKIPQLRPQVAPCGVVGGCPTTEEDPLIARSHDNVRVNEMIRAQQVRVVDEEGNQLGIMSPADALREAEKRDLDLVEVAEKATPPVCRIMDYGKYRYMQSKRAKEARKHQHQVTVKEIKYRPKIDPHDFDFKTNHVRQFLQDGSKVKITIMFRGRELAHPEFGREILARVVEATKDLSQTDFDPNQSRLEGRNMSLMLNPSR